jgi:hypothetical protein
LSQPGLIEQSLDLLRRGFTPVLVLQGSEVHVSTDFMVAAALAKQQGQAPLVAVPIRELLLEHFASLEPTLPKKAKFSPAKRVLEATKTGDRRAREFVPTGRWKFKLK